MKQSTSIPHIPPPTPPRAPHGLHLTAHRTASHSGREGGLLAVRSRAPRAVQCSAVECIGCGVVWCGMVWCGMVGGASLRSTIMITSHTLTLSCTVQCTMLCQLDQVQSNNETNNNIVCPHRHNDFINIFHKCVIISQIFYSVLFINIIVCFPISLMEEIFVINVL